MVPLPKCASVSAGGRWWLHRDLQPHPQPFPPTYVSPAQTLDLTVKI